MTSAEGPLLLGSAASLNALITLWQTIGTPQPHVIPSLQVTFKHLAPESLQGVTDVRDFPWVLKTTYTFRSAYFSYKRTVPERRRQPELLACLSVLRELGSIPNENIDELTHSVMRETEMICASRMGDELAALKSDPTKDWAMIVGIQRRKHDLPDHVPAPQANPHILGQAIARSIFRNKREEFLTRIVYPRVARVYRRRALEAIRRVCPGVPEEVLARRVGHRVMHSPDISVIAPYQIQYSVFVVDERAINRERKEKKRAKKAEIMTIKRGNLEVAAAATKHETMPKVRAQGHELLAYNDQLDAQLEAALREIDEHYDDLLRRGRRRKLIGRFSMSATNSAAGVNAKVAEPRSTEATLVGTPMLKPDGSTLQVHMEWQELRPSYVPRLDAVTHARPVRETGNLVFTADGNVTGETGMILSLFKQLMTRVETPNPLIDQPPAHPSGPLTRASDREGRRPPERKYGHLHSSGSAQGPLAPRLADPVDDEEPLFTVDPPNFVETRRPPRQYPPPLSADESPTLLEPDEPLPPSPDDELPLESDDEPLPPEPDDESPTPKPPPTPSPPPGTPPGSSDDDFPTPLR